MSVLSTLEGPSPSGGKESEHWAKMGRSPEVYTNDEEKAKRQLTQSAFACSKLTTETLEQGVKYVQS